MVGPMHPSAPPPPATGRTVLVPEAPVLIAGLREALWVSADGEVAHLPAAEAVRRARAEPPLLCHAKATMYRLAHRQGQRLGGDPFPAYDVLELFAFVRPAAFCTPTPRGLAVALGLAPPGDLFAAARCLHDVTAALLAELAASDRKRDPGAASIAEAMARGGWGWSRFVLAALGENTNPRRGLAVWNGLPSWSEQAPPPPPGQDPVSATDARARLAQMLGAGAEARPQQADYASAVSQAFAPRAAAGEPKLVLAEAGTGVGKTLGYLAPASLWAEKNAGTVWISTYTRNLQHQIDGELDRLYPTRAEKTEQVVVRKGRENYLCLLNLEEAVNGLTMRPGDAVAVGLMARWTARTRDGDMVGGDFPGWLADLAGRGRTLGLTDRRGECIYSACSHYGKCFIERGIRRARHARIVIANHALVMIQAALGGSEDGQLPSRYVFDEGHHIFAAADNAFAAHLSGREGQALRRWLLGAESTGGQSGSSGRRARGLRRRVEDLIEGSGESAGELSEPLAAALTAAHVLPGDGWHLRLASAQPYGVCERFLAAVRQQVYARVNAADTPYSLEAPLHPPLPEMIAAAADLAHALARVAEPLALFRKRLAARLDDQAATLESETRRRIEAICRSIERRALLPLAAWQHMLGTLGHETPPEFVDWLAVERGDGRDLDVGFYRHWVDPTVPFAAALLAGAHGAVITSATLTDGSGDADADWSAAERRTGASHMPNPAIRAQVPSPFDYAAQTRAIVVTDLPRGDMAPIAAAYRELFLAAGGGALGLFTAISRLRDVHGRIGGPLEEAGLSLYAQHVDGMDVATLVDIFRGEEDSCLLGTDAVRDGIDVPGRALRLIVFDRVPWPRPDLAHKARREAFGGRTYDDVLTRLRLRQAFGRLVRRADDRGVFVLLDSRLPSRLASAFPEGVSVQRLGLAKAVASTREFLA